MVRRRNNANLRSPEPDSSFRSAIGIIFVHFFSFFCFISLMVFVVVVWDESGLQYQEYVLMFTVIATSAYCVIYIYCCYERFQGR
jgi:hypothetical protein